jgi:hypothetical protein
MTYPDYQTIATVTGDMVLYRDLEPYDTTLPRLAELRAVLGIPDHTLPRKRDADYGRVVFELLKRAQAQRSELPLSMVLVVGDTDNDRLMAAHLRSASGLPVYAFIGADHPEQEPGYSWQGNTATATRWALLDDWRKLVAWRHDPDNGAMPWEQTALLLDIDKTLLGPRGRCDAAINEARAEAAFRVAQVLLGDDLSEEGFYTLYDTLCRSEFHVLTLDNQDYVVYITLLLASGILPVNDFVAGINNDTLTTFSRLLEAVTPRIPAPLAHVHADIRTLHEAGDPTPFKAFRRTELAATASRMVSGQLSLCRELVALSQWMVEQGALCLAASDKPAESALPSPEQKEMGMLPLHHTPAKVE